MQERHFLETTIEQFRGQKKLADKAMDQLNDEQFFASLGAESNSIALILKHVAGNLRSRWTDFLTTDGDKSDRNRDTEFLNEERDTRASLVERWEAAWQVTQDALEELTPADLDKTVTIRSEPHTVVRAIQRSLAHTAQHVGQIILLAKHYAGAQWQTLSIPRGKSQEFQKQLEKKHGA
ncbi:MAG TPA: DinB family protein [Candidatus Acidoferrales bacterium]|nr:DinB family protein [Candidatus Acidoferrales bacterium]